MNNFKIKEFPSEVIKELGFYVYRLIDPRNGETFEHIKCSITEDNDEENFNLKYKRIRDIDKSGLDVIHVIHRHGLDSSTAFHVEASLIDIIPGIANKLGGHYSSELGPMNAYEILTRYKAEIAELKHKFILININRTINDRDIYDAVRFAWKLDVDRAKKAEYVLAIEKGIIVGIYKPLTWHLARKQYFPEFENHTNKRYGFIGEEVDDDLQSMYLRKRIPEQYRKKGASNPVKYSYDK